MDDGLQHHQEMLRLAGLHDDPDASAIALLGMAQARTYAGDPGGGLALAQEQHRVAQRLGNPSLLALALYDQAEALSGIEPERAREHYQRAAELAAAAGSTFIEGITLVGLASLLGRSGGRRAWRCRSSAPSSTAGTTWASGSTSGRRCATSPSC